MQKMDWNKLLSTKRFGLEDYHDPNKKDRTQFQRDYDRLVFSPSFRRLQNKTQVFPLPGNIFVHNRLTHSLEVSCVGRSLGNNISTLLREKYGDSLTAFADELGTIVSVGCLAHDMGNPPFGHSGETAISTYFSEGNGLPLKQEYGLTDEQWADIIHFEGNANALRLLTHQFGGHRPGGFVLTYSSIASVVKYPFVAAMIEKLGKKKFGFFQAEKDSYKKIAEELGIICYEPGHYARHPLVYLVEAADDICYEIMDLEDAHKLRLLSTEQTIGLMKAFCQPERIDRINSHLEIIDDINEKIAYLRSCVVGVLVGECTRVFMENEDAILAGVFSGSLIDNMSDQVKAAYKNCQKVSEERIYCSRDVADVEIAGYNIIYTLIDRLTQAVFSPEKAYSKQLLNRIPKQYDFEGKTPYEKLLSVLDYVSSMTDIYALDLYQKITGMSLPQL